MKKMMEHKVNRVKRKIGSFKQGIDGIIDEFEIPHDFPQKVILEAEQLKPPSAEDMEGRVDLQSDPIVTIDGETARDFDDAVCVTRVGEGQYRLTVSIADVSHYVQPGTVLDHEAYYRGNSVYFPNRCIPMLPEQLSNHLCSLEPHQARRTMSAEMIFEAHGRRVSSRFYSSVIKSHARLTYTEVKKILVDRDADVRKKYESLLPALEVAFELAQLITKQRTDRGSIDFDLPESQIVFGPSEGSATDDLEDLQGTDESIHNITKAERNIAHRLIEEFMIAANEAVAEFILEKNISSLYRVHNPPEKDRVKDFTLLLHNLGYHYSLRKADDPKTFAGILPLVRGKPEDRLVNTVLLRTMNRAIYSSANDGHFGLASECYTHFTSPIRRYPDLVVHRALKQSLGLIKVRKSAAPKREKKQQKKRDEAMERVAHHCSETERNAMKAEWASRDLAACLFMSDKIDQEFSGIVSNITKFGLFVEFDEYFLDGLVPLRLLTDDHYVFHEKAHLLVGRKTKKRLQVGQRVRVKVVNINLEKRWIDLVFV